MHFGRPFLANSCTWTTLFYNPFYPLSVHNMSFPVHISWIAFSSFLCQVNKIAPKYISPIFLLFHLFLASFFIRYLFISDWNRKTLHPANESSQPNQPPWPTTKQVNPHKPQQQQRYLFYYYLILPWSVHWPNKTNHPRFGLFLPVSFCLCPWMDSSLVSILVLLIHCLSIAHPPPIPMVSHWPLCLSLSRSPFILVHSNIWTIDSPPHPQPHIIWSHPYPQIIPANRNCSALLSTYNNNNSIWPSSYLMWDKYLFRVILWVHTYHYSACPSKCPHWPRAFFNRYILFEINSVCIGISFLE